MLKIMSVFTTGINDTVSCKYLCCDSSITSKRVEHRRFRVAAISLSLTNSVLHVDVGKLDKTVLAIMIV